MVQHSGLRLALGLLVNVPLLVLPVPASCQSHESILTRPVEAQMDSLASHAAQRIREANLEEKEPRVLVIDFFRGTPGDPSRLGTLLADRFSESLGVYSAGINVLDRRILKDYLFQNWTTLEDLRPGEVSLRIGRQLGATGVIRGTLHESNGQLSLTIHLDGFGPPTKGKDVFAATDEAANFPVTEAMHEMLFQPGPNYVRTADIIPQEPGIFTAGVGGVTSPACVHCPAPDYSDAARTAKYQGTVLLSVVVTAEGQVTSIYVLKGAPFGVTAKAIEAVRQWRLQPALKDGNPVPARVALEMTFRFF